MDQAVGSINFLRHAHRGDSHSNATQRLRTSASKEVAIHAPTPSPAGDVVQQAVPGKTSVGTVHSQYGWSVGSHVHAPPCWHTVWPSRSARSAPLPRNGYGAGAWAKLCRRRAQLRDVGWKG